MDGHGILEIKKVGDETEFGKVAEKATEMSGEETPLNKQLDKLAKFIGVVGFGLATLTFLVLFIKDLFLGETQFTIAQIVTVGIVMLSVVIALTKVWLPIIYDLFELLGKEKKLPKSVKEGSWLRWFLYGILAFLILSAIGFLFGVNLLKAESWISLEVAGRILQYFMVAVTLIVVSVPEGLPMSVTLSLALSMRRMLQNNNLVRKMHACETMGAITVICTDKTGTLTQNQMQVYKADFMCLDGKALANEENSNIIKESIAVNSTAYLDYSEPPKIKTLGNPTEAALLLWLHEQGFDYFDIRKNAEIIEQLTFSTEKKYMATLVNSPLLNKKVLYVKGAPEKVLSRCSHVLTEKGLKPIDGYISTIENSLLHIKIRPCGL